MDKLFGKMLQHPIASMFVIGALGSAVTSVIEATRRPSK